MKKIFTKANCWQRKVMDGIEYNPTYYKCMLIHFQVYIWKCRKKGMRYKNNCIEEISKWGESLLSLYFVSFECYKKNIFIYYVTLSKRKWMKLEGMRDERYYTPSSVPSSISSILRSLPRPLCQRSNWDCIFWLNIKKHLKSSNFWANQFQASRVR